MIEVRQVSKVYQVGGQPVVALRDVNLSVRRGEIYGIIGLSGAGKSTLVRCINMLERPQSGSILVDGVDITRLEGEELRAARRQIGMIFQNFNLLQSRTVAGNVAFPLEIAGVPQAEIKRRVSDLLELVGLTDKAKAYPAQLSGGQKQRVGIARALANQPKVLLSDEATSALDPQTTKSILRLLLDINQRLGLTIVLITHEMQVIKEICDSVAVIENGTIVESGPVWQVFTEPRTAAARNFLRGVITPELPPEVLERLIAEGGGENQILRLSFLGEQAGQPLISSLIRLFDVDVNILYGSIDHIKDIPFGTLIVEVKGGGVNPSRLISYLRGRGVKVEVIAGVVEPDLDSAVGGLS
ncbi:MAG: methionine ABC transporter ATP-binding protein [Bacillota bacterium]|nr:methionine ABC transporter ATP-binding protein [Bacillota bacterium]